MKHGVSPTDVVQHVLYELLNDQRHRWQAVHASFSTIFDELDTMVLSGGKRIRSAFLHAGWVTSGGQQDDSVHWKFAGAIELLHACALFHDDVIDDSSIRRGHVTTHRRLAMDHSEDNLLGESRRFGEGSAILIGDVAFALADFLMTELPPSARPMWNEIRLEMNMGQYLDTVGTALRERDITFAHTVSRLKTAKYTIERPLHIGALAADAERGNILLPLLSAYAIPLGIAFQLRDDILGAYGDESVTGKPVGGDFREGKPTALIAHAFGVASTAQLQVLNMIGDASLSTANIERIQEVLVETGSLEHVEALVREYELQAHEAVVSPDIDDDSRNMLLSLANSVTDRSR